MYKCPLVPFREVFTPHPKGQTLLIALLIFSKQSVFTKQHGVHLSGPAGHAVYPPVEEDHHHHRREEGPDGAVEDVPGVTVSSYH